MLQYLKNLYHLIVAVLANMWYGWPGRKLTVIGVTGTDGKTTTVSLIYHILKTAGFKTSMISSVGAIVAGKTYDIGFHVTTPSPFSLQRFLKKAVSAGSKFLVLEVTSHALDQYRVWGIPFAAGVLTNVTEEHLDYHKTYENYVLTKTKLLRMAMVSVVNRDDISYKFVSAELTGHQTVTYGMKGADVTPKRFPLKTDLPGEFNTYNILAAIAVCRALGVKDELIRRAIKSFKLPVGRVEIVHENSFTIMIDFAHTPNALVQILRSVKPRVKGRIIHVFGSAGFRDYQKRPSMGRVSIQYADVTVITAEDPRSEGVEKITEQIASEIQNSEFRIQNGTLFKIPDRQEAITKAVKMARKEDFVLITGKGHEKSMNYGKGEVFWSEHEAVKKALRSRSG